MTALSSSEQVIRRLYQVTQDYNKGFEHQIVELLKMGLERFGLYIGVPIRPNGELYGTLNLSSPAPYPRKFHDFDIDALQLMASWIEVELIRREQEGLLNALNQELRLQADFDSLTRVPNRRGMYMHLHKGLNEIMRAHESATLAIIDIDHFKKLNDFKYCSIRAATRCVVLRNRHSL